MRFLFAAAFALVASTASADAPDARAAYVERRGLIEADTQCRLFTPGVRAALEIGAAQARGSLLRAGWSLAQVRELEQTVVAAARARACNDARTTEAAAGARASFGQWANAGAMEFPGWERTWIARRTVNGGWRLSQSIDAPVAATFGVRERDGVQRLTLTIAVARGATAPNAVQMLLRDRARGHLVEVSLTQRVASGLAAGAPAPGAATTLPSARRIERLDGGRSLAVFEFPDNAFAELVALDPRESIELRVSDGRTTRRLLVEVGDIAAARAFLTIPR